MRAVKALLIFLVGAIASLIVSYAVIFRPRIKAWGVDPVETEAALAGDDVIVDPMATETRGVTIDAPVSEVWPWLVQMGFGRAGWYSFESMDKRYKSADAILPEFQKLVPGEIMPVYNGGGFEVRTVDPEHALVLYTDSKIMNSQAAAAEGSEPTDGDEVVSMNGDKAASKRAMSMRMGSDFSASWAFILNPTDDGQTRLVERFRVKATGNVPANAMMQELMSTGIVLMARKQMLGIKDRAERPAVTEHNGHESTDLPTGSHDPQIDIPTLTSDSPAEASPAV